jgi:hypothetical protein
MIKVGKHCGNGKYEIILELTESDLYDIGFKFPLNDGFRDDCFWAADQIQYLEEVRNYVPPKVEEVPRPKKVLRSHCTCGHPGVGCHCSMYVETY